MHRQITALRLSLQLQSAQAKIEFFHQELTKFRFNETAFDSKLNTVSHGKRLRVDDDIGDDMDVSPRIAKVTKRVRSASSPLKDNQPEDGGSVFEGAEENLSQRTNEEDYRKFTVLRLKEELTKQNYGAQLLRLKNPNKKDIIALYEQCVLQKS